MFLLLAVLACAATPSPSPEAAASSPEAGAMATQAVTVHSPTHAPGDHATVQHGFGDVQKWAAVFDDPARDAWQKPAELVAALQLPAGATVADLGAGTGYLNAHLAAAVGATGKVIAVDIEPALVDHMARRAGMEGTPQVQPRLGRADDPGLAQGEVDVVLLVDTYHHIDGRVDYFRRLREAVREGGRLVVVDFRMGQLPVGPPDSHKLPQAQVVAELVEAGWTEAGSLDILPHQFVQVMSR